MPRHNHRSCRSSFALSTTPRSLRTSNSDPGLPSDSQPLRHWPQPLTAMDRTPASPLSPQTSPHRTSPNHRPPSPAFCCSSTQEPGRHTHKHGTMSSTPSYPGRPTREVVGHFTASGQHITAPSGQCVKVRVWRLGLCLWENFIGRA